MRDVKTICKLLLPCFSESFNPKSAVSGNWPVGMAYDKTLLDKYNGDAYLTGLIHMMAASEAGRDLT
jgi:hypothetical protein